MFLEPELVVLILPIRSPSRPKNVQLHNTAKSEYEILFGCIVDIAENQMCIYLAITLNMASSKL